MRGSLSRRAFVGSAIGAGAFVVPLAQRANAATNLLYELRADWGAGNPNCVNDGGAPDCGGCYACVNHARNKVFATAAAADAGRAHAQCRCKVASLYTIDDLVYDKLFAHRRSVDRRTPGINALLARTAFAYAPRRSLPRTGAPLASLALEGAGAVVVGTVLWRAGRTANPPIA
jgi:hypothetical protein